MGNNGSSLSNEKKENLKNDLEEMYSQVLSSEHIEQTIQGQYCNNLQVIVTNDILKKYSNEYLKENAKNVVLGYSEKKTEDINKICDRLAKYYIKKINLIGTIINCVRLAHIKLDRIKNGGICYGGEGNALQQTASKFNIPVEPSIPFKIDMNPELILLDDDILKIRQETLKKVKKSGVQLDENSLLHNLAIIEIDNPEECSRAGGSWLSTRQDAEKIYVVPTEELRKENKRWFDTMNSLENAVYGKIGQLVSTLDLLVEERVEPKMVNGTEERIKMYRDRLIYDKDLDSLVIKTKKILVELFVDLDSYFLILTSINVIGQEHVDEMNEMEMRLKELKTRGK